MRCWEEGRGGVTLGEIVGRSRHARVGMVRWVGEEVEVVGWWGWGVEEMAVEMVGVDVGVEVGNMEGEAVMKMGEAVAGEIVGRAVVGCIVVGCKVVG
ncbi:hypothetical protein CYMTET_41885 [Cymbomonas tetramitiformis]|uniref:Uncharacterized protein n=1 Tax=Cymbomonas tetramitiformis TaxID=36881 RepID=A0AAE0C7B4_9CHLO|nr:hypothetical protein CYMTET_41885 [Cymbomonas tetramitiformis]